MKFMPTSNIEQHAEFDPDICGHARHMCCPDASIRDTRHHGILESHQEAQSQDWNRPALLLRQPELSAAKQHHQNRLSQYAECIDAMHLPPSASIDQQRGNCRAANEGKNDGQVERTGLPFTECCMVGK